MQIPELETHAADEEDTRHSDSLDFQNDKVLDRTADTASTSRQRTPSLDYACACRRNHTASLVRHLSQQELQQQTIMGLGSVLHHPTRY